MPPSEQNVLIFFDHYTQLRKLVAPKSAGTRELDWLEPELGDTLSLLNVNVRRFAPFEAKEEEPISLDAQNSWHLTGI